MSLSLHEQLKLHIEDPLEFNNIFAHDCWTLEEYKEFFGYVDKGWIVQGDSWDLRCNGFIVNQEWEDEPLWTPSEECDKCGFEDVSWCESNGCDKGKRRLEYLQEEKPINWNKIIFNDEVNCFDCPSCKKAILYSLDDNCNYCPECDKRFTQDEIDNGEVEEDVYNCETCDKEVKDKHYGLSYGCLSISLCEQCYEKEKPKKKFNVKKKKIQIQWSEEFCDDMTDGRCYFCNKKNYNDWDASCEDAVCIECSEKWKYNEDEDSYYEL